MRGLKNAWHDPADYSDPDSDRLTPHLAVYSGSWGYYPSGGFALLVVIVIVLLLMGRI